MSQGSEVIVIRASVYSVEQIDKDSKEVSPIVAEKAVSGLENSIDGVSINDSIQNYNDSWHSKTKMNVTIW